MQNALAAVEALIGREAAAQQRAQKRAGARGGAAGDAAGAAGDAPGDAAGAAGDAPGGAAGAAGAAGDAAGDAPGRADGKAHDLALLLLGFDSLEAYFESMHRCVSELTHALAGGKPADGGESPAPLAAPGPRTGFDGGESPAPLAAPGPRTGFDGGESPAPLAAPGPRTGFDGGVSPAPLAAPGPRTGFDGGVSPAPLAAPGPRTGFESDLERLAVKVLASTLPNAALKKNHVPVDTPVFKPKAREGGNLSRTSVSHREIHVALDHNNLAMWQPNPRNARFIAATRAFLETQTLLDSSDIRVRREGLLHPLLGVSSAFVSTPSRPHLIDKIYGHVATPEKSFGQFLCEIAIRSQPTRDGWIWEFDPEAWNRVGHRIVVGGASSGGKPRIVFERA
jgi:hypothetical protein